MVLGIMFTGIIRELGTVSSVDTTPSDVTLHIKASNTKTLSLGDSIAVNGACLTVLDNNTTQFSVRLMQETINKTNLNFLKSGARVNLEKPLKVGQTVDGHFVLGHVDGIAKVLKITNAGDDKVFTFALSASLMKYIIPKGSVALDGVSLTVVDVYSNSFTVSMMPFTLKHTTFGQANVGYRANIETDVLGKYAIGQNIHQPISKAYEISN
jgi:riboflavin synthase